MVFAVAGALLRAKALAAASLSAVLSISIEPLKYAPSSIIMRAVVRSPFTDPSFLISMRSLARRFPFTVPETTTSRAIISAVTLALAPTVSFRSSSVISPSTVPSISRSSLPEISPLTCRLEPSRAPVPVRSPVFPSGRIASVPVAMLVVPSQAALAGFGGSLKLNFLGAGSEACGVSGLLLLHIDPPKGQPRKQQDVLPGKANSKPWDVRLQMVRGPHVRYSYWTRGQGAPR